MEKAGQQNNMIFIVGPTAAGKSSIAIEVAKQCGGEIISCDAMQVYKEIRVASNRPTDADLAVVPHHLVGFLSVTEDFDVARFNQIAREKITAILGRQGTPVVVGGSGLYMTILLDGIFLSGGRDMILREQLRNEAESFGAGYLHERLLAQDPDAAAKIHSNDLRRIIRALEVLSVDKQPISRLQTSREGLWGKHDIRIYCVTRERDNLYARINKRVDSMFAEGIIEEIKGINALELSHTASGLIGIKEIRAYLDGSLGLEDAKELLKRNTRRYAKRQLTWFRKDKRLCWVTINEEDDPSKVAEAMLQRPGA